MMFFLTRLSWIYEVIEAWSGKRHGRLCSQSYAYIEIGVDALTLLSAILTPRLRMGRLYAIRV